MSAAACAADTKILAFEQFINPSEKQAYTAAAPAVAPNAQVWSAVYMVVQANQAPDNTALGFKVIPQGILFKAAPAKKLDQYALEGINLAKKKQYSLTQFQDLAEMIQDQTGKKIEEAPVFNADQAHVYARVEDWVPEYNTQAAGLSIELGPLQDMDVKGLYIMMGEGEKPKDLTALANLDPMFKSQYHADTAEAKAEARSSFREARWMILLVVLAMGIYLGWYRRT